MSENKEKWDKQFDVSIVQHDGLLCCFRKKLENLVPVLGIEKCLS